MFSRRHDVSNATLKVTMDRHQLATHIRRHGIWAITEMFCNSAAQVVMGLRDAVNIHGWEMTAAPGVIRFALRRDPQPGLPDEIVIYLNTDNPQTIANWTAELPDDLPCPFVLVTKAEGKIDQERDPGWLAVKAAYEAGAL